MTVGRSVSEKSYRMTWRFEWMPRREKFSEKPFRALSSRNRMWEGVVSEEEDAPKQRGFWDGVDFHLGAIEQLTKERERERNTKKHQQYQYQYKDKWRYICIKMHEHVICNIKSIIGSAQSKPTSTHHCNKVNTHLKCMTHFYNADVMQCMMF